MMKNSINSHLEGYPKSEDSVLEVRKLCTGYGKRNIVEDVDLKVFSGEILSIIGPNGSGKSTLLKAMARLLKPFSGEVFLEGKNIWGLNEKNIAKKMAIMPQSADLPGDIIVRDLVKMGRVPHQNFWQESNAKDREAVDRAISLTGLEHLQYRGAMALSGGERQRARLAMALAQEPEILILDEPTTYLDIRHQLELMLLIHRLHDELGLTVIMVLHDLNHAARFSSRIVAMKKGRLLAEGKVEEIFQERFIRQLYGVENCIMPLKAGEYQHLVCLPHGIYKEEVSYA